MTPEHVCDAGCDLRVWAGSVIPEYVTGGVAPGVCLAVRMCAF